MYAVFMLSFGFMPAMGEQMIPDMALSPGEVKDDTWTDMKPAFSDLTQQSIFKKVWMEGGRGSLY